MTWMDRWIQKQRINRALPYIPTGSILLDIGCHQGELLDAIGDRIREGYGMDPLLSENISKPRYMLIKGMFPGDWHEPGKLDCITALAVLEHIPVKNLSRVVSGIFESLTAGGLAILTVPSLKADRILNFLKRMGLIHGMSLEEHHGYNPGETKSLFENAGFILQKHTRFQFGINNLFIFQKQQAPNNL